MIFLSPTFTLILGSEGGAIVGVNELDDGVDIAAEDEDFLELDFGVLITIELLLALDDDGSGAGE